MNNNSIKLDKIILNFFEHFVKKNVKKGLTMPHNSSRILLLYYGVMCEVTPTNAESWG